MGHKATGAAEKNPGALKVRTHGMKNHTNTKYSFPYHNRPHDIYTICYDLECWLWLFLGRWEGLLPGVPRRGVAVLHTT